LYIGTLLIRANQASDGLRLLGEANRIDSGCPLVSLQIGLGIVAANGDAALASRALNRAIGGRGLSQWIKTPAKLWLDGFPEGRSYIRRLAAKHRYSCPVFGTDVGALIRQAELALAQAEYRQDHFQEAADQYERLLHDAPPSAPLVRGLGLSLARLERYDQAYKPLRAALDMEEPKDPLTAGYLGQCGMGANQQRGLRPGPAATGVHYHRRPTTAMRCAGQCERRGFRGRRCVCTAGQGCAPGSPLRMRLAVLSGCPGSWL